ncbi:hypothetical protein GCM10023339_41470 [Alloalcanivorax gelatiniphagus]
MAYSTRHDPDGPDTTTIMLTAASVVLLTVGVSSTAWWIAGRPTSEWPSWIEAGATVAAVGAAIVAGFYAARAFGLEFQREQRWEESQRSAQASLIGAWPMGFGVASTSTSPRIGSGRVMIRNASQLPVTQVRVTIFHERDDDDDDVLRMVTTRDVGHLPPSDEPIPIDFGARGFGEVHEVPVVNHQDGRLAVEVWFRDSSGVEWHRTHSGELFPAPH